MKIISLNNAVSQFNRALPPLVDGYVNINGYTEQDYLFFADEFAGLLNYYDLTDTVDGDWIGFFITDFSFLLAYINSTDVEELQSVFNMLCEHTLNEPDPLKQTNDLRRVFQQVLLVARSFNLFLRFLNRSALTEVSNFRRVVINIIENDLAPQLRILKGYAEGAALPTGINCDMKLNFVEFLPLWDVKNVKPDDSIYTGNTIGKKIRCAISALRPLFSLFINQLVRVKFAAGELFTDTLNRKHEPDTGLYLCFIKLFSTAIAKMNSLTPKYKDFYYTDVLKQYKKAAVEDQVFLTFTLNATTGLNSYKISSSTLFPYAKNADNEDVYFRSEQGLIVNSASLQAVLTVFCRRGDIINMEGEGDLPETKCGVLPVIPLRGLTGVFKGNYLERDGENSFFPQKKFPVLGNALPGSGNQYADIGFLIKSPQLMLGGGKRTIQVSFFTTEESAKAIFESISAIIEETGKQDVLNYILGSAFNISLSTTDGWLLIADYTARSFVKSGEQGFTIVINLPENAPPIATQDLSDGSALPAIKFITKQTPVIIKGKCECYIYPISIISLIEVTQINITTEVAGLRNLGIVNSESDVDPTSPFSFFGAVPVKGSYLDISSPEIFSKHINKIDISIDWFGLPANTDGFTGYYRYYTLNADGEPLAKKINNSTFKVSLSVENAGYWAMSSVNISEPVYNLFSTSILPSVDNVVTEAIEPVTDFDHIPLVKNVLPPYYNPADGFIRIKLSEPPFAFGNDIYPVNLLNAVTKDYADLPACEAECLKLYPDNPAELKKCIEKCMVPTALQFPNPPFLPLASKIELCYKGMDVLDFRVENTGSEIEFSYIEPFGNSKPQYNVPAKLLPQIDEGNLYLGLTGLSTDTELSVFFSMYSDGRTPEIAPKITWSVLSANNWTVLPPNAVLADNTNGLTKTGIIKFLLPSVSIYNNTTLPADVYWLRASCQARAETLPYSKAIYLNALLAGGNTMETGQEKTGMIPAGTIDSSIPEMPDIEVIMQPFASFGGKNREDEKMMTVRVAERLQHKQRAILNWDYERLVLQQFPEVFKVKCLQHRTAHKTNLPGKVLVVVVPGKNSDTDMVEQTPYASNAQLKLISQYLYQYVSPFIELEVCNPAYVKIRVEASVEFLDQQETGGNLQTLNQELIKYLSPWFYDFEREGLNGEYITAENIERFIQTRPYIAFLDDFKLHYDPAPCDMTTDWCFYTSANEHFLKQKSTPV